MFSVDVQIMSITSRSCNSRQYCIQGVSVASRLADALKRAEEGVSARAVQDGKCSEFFSNQTVMDTVMKTEGSLIEKYDLETCCSE